MKLVPGGKKSEENPLRTHNFTKRSFGIQETDHSTMNYLLAGLGLVLLFLGAKSLITGASALGRIAGISPIVIGLTVVAYGTSAPELVVSTMGAWQGQYGLALGNVIGSNIFNTLFILGLSGTLVPIVVNQRLLQYDVPIMIIVSLMIYALSWNGLLGFGEGTLLFLVFIGYSIWTILQSENESDSVQEEYEREYSLPQDEIGFRNLMYYIALVVGGLALLIIGARLFTNAMTTIARSFGVSELVIGLTIVATGTSLPEVGTSVMAALRNEPDIAVGNVIGSNFINVTGILGVSTMITGKGIPLTEGLLIFELPILILVSVLCLPIFFTGHRISRWESILFLLYYVLYTVSLLLPQMHPFVTHSLSYMLVVFVIPLTSITIVIGIYRHYMSPST
jgi:cation:H+ antiporter